MPKTVTVKMINGELDIQPPKIKLKGEFPRDSMRVKNKTGQPVYWIVDAGLQSAPFNIRVNDDDTSGARIAAAHKSSAEYTYQISLTRSRRAKKSARKRSKRSKRRSDPIIIIDVD